MLCSAARESPLAHSEHPFFKRVQLVKSRYPCFLTPQSPKCETPVVLWQATANDYIAAGATGCEAQAIAIT